MNMVEEATLPVLQKDAYTFTADIWEHQDSEKSGYNEGINVVAMDLNRIHHTFGREDYYYDDHYYQKKETPPMKFISPARTRSKASRRSKIGLPTSI